MTGRNQKATKHVSFWMKNPDPGSIFDKRTKLVRWLPTPLLMILLLAFGYDGVLLVSDEGEIIGHIFYQMHQGIWEAFSVYVREDLKGRGYASEMSREFIVLARKRGARGFKFGKGTKQSMVKLSKKAMEGRLNLPPTFHLRLGSFDSIEFANF